MASDDEALKAFIERAAELDQTRETQIDETDVREIAQAVGLSDEALDRARTTGQQSLERGKQYVDHGRWDDAIEELGEAVVLLPGHLDPRLQLARAHAGRYAELGKSEDRERATKLARQCIDEDPDCSAAYDVLDRVDRSGTKTKDQRIGTVIGTIAVVLVLSGGATGVYLANGSSHHHGHHHPHHLFRDGTPTKKLPVEFVDEAKSGLKLEVRKSEYGGSSDDLRFDVLAVLDETGKVELGKVEGRVELLDANGQTLNRNMETLRLDLGPKLWPGEQIPAWIYEYDGIKPGATKARLTITYADTTPAGEHEPLKRVKTDWSEVGGTPPKLVFRERQKTISHYDGEGSLHLVFEVENEGRRPIHHLDVRADALSRAEKVVANGNVLSSNDALPVTSNDPPLIHGDVRMFSIFVDAPDGYDHYRLVVTSMK